MIDFGTFGPPRAEPQDFVDWEIGDPAQMLPGRSYLVMIDGRYTPLCYHGTFHFNNGEIEYGFSDIRGKPMFVTPGTPTTQLFTPCSVCFAAVHPATLDASERCSECQP